MDASKTSASNWLRFINCARTEEEQNLYAYQHKGEIYYVSFKAIEPGSELLVWYGPEYAEQLGISLTEEERNPEGIVTNIFLKQWKI